MDKKLTLKEMKRIWKEANTSGIKAGTAATPKPVLIEMEYGDTKKTYLNDEGLCGFAGVIIEKRQMRIVNLLRKIGVHLWKNYYGGHYIPAPNSLGQSLERQKKWAEAVCEVLEKYGIHCHINARLD